MSFFTAGIVRLQADLGQDTADLVPDRNIDGRQQLKSLLVHHKGRSQWHGHGDGQVCDRVDDLLVQRATHTVHTLREMFCFREAMIIATLNWQKVPKRRRSSSIGRGKSK